MEQEVIRSIGLFHQLGEDLHAHYGSQTIDQVTVPVSNTIKRNKILTFGNRPDLTKKGNKTSGVQKKNMTLITQLFLSIQSRPDADMAEFSALRTKGNHQVWLIVDHFEQARSLTSWNALKHQLVEQIQPDQQQLLCWTWQLLFIW